MTSLRLTDHRRVPIFVGGLALIVAMVALANVACAHVVQVTTAIDIADIKSPHDFERALQDAVEDAAKGAIAFEPAVVALTGMRVIGDRVLVGVLFADEAGKQMLEGLGHGTDQNDSPDDDQPARPTKIVI